MTAFNQKVLEKLIDIIKEIAVEQGTREFSGIAWTQEVLKKLSTLQVDIAMANS